MSIQALIAIAELCRATANGQPERPIEAEQRQHSCQIYYVECTEKEMKKDTYTIENEALTTCVKGKK